MTRQDEALKQVARSGFPFQLRVEDEVKSSFQKHNWSVVSREHPWTNPSTASAGFIDLVLQQEPFRTLRLVVECKRMKATDSRQLRWVFLIPDSDPKPTELASCLEVEALYDEQAQPPTSRDDRIWDNVFSRPPSLQSQFCVLPNDEQRRQPILESLSVELLDSIEGLAEEEVHAARSRGRPYHQRLFIFPAIVTNAEIAVCRFNSSLVNIADGTIDPANADISSVPFIRFRKSITTRFPAGGFPDLHSANCARERTVFVVNGESIVEFLTGWEINPKDPFAGYAIERILRKDRSAPT